MKYLLALLIVLLNSLSFAQAFHFNDVQTILIKTTDESPAHWYLEIFSDVPVDTTLRWKAHYGPTLPAEWEFNFDDQNQFHFPILDGDSANFTLFANPILTQKLIIGAMLNNTPGNGSIYFDVYDPSDLSTLVTIEYRFIVSQGSATISELNSDQRWFTHQDRTLYLSDELIGAQLAVVDLGGKEVFATKHCDAEVTLPESCASGSYIVRLEHSGTAYWSRIFVY